MAESHVHAIKFGWPTARWFLGHSNESMTFAILDVWLLQLFLVRVLRGLAGPLPRLVCTFQLHFPPHPPLTCPSEIWRQLQRKRSIQLSDRPRLLPQFDKSLRDHPVGIQRADSNYDVSVTCCNSLIYAVLSRFDSTSGFGSLRLRWDEFIYPKYPDNLPKLVIPKPRYGKRDAHNGWL